MDVGFTGYAGCGGPSPPLPRSPSPTDSLRADPDICEKTKRLFPPKPAVALSQMSRFKAILDLDGMAFSGRFLALMGMGSAVFKSSIYSDFAADWVEPYYQSVILLPSLGREADGWEQLCADQLRVRRARPSSTSSSLAAVN